MKNAEVQSQAKMPFITLADKLSYTFNQTRRMQVKLKLQLDQVQPIEPSSLAFDSPSKLDIFGNDNFYSPTIRFTILCNSSKTPPKASPNLTEPTQKNPSLSEQLRPL